ncbi:hypothetical protein VTN77DRAFT_3347 [Rasamsonia byssochlamydoides]|uniref:uncharacterized protein n=1 Tax=Rasamsonia byssochlamydoides TaxID=89139 RepID=UPI003741F797
MYNLSLSVPFDKQTNLTGLFNAMSKNDGLLNSNIAPNYNDGVMFANDDEFILYGGLSLLTDSQDPPPADVVLGYEEYEWGLPPPSWQPGFVQKSLPAGITRYVTNGAGVSAPSENLGFYFSGMRGADWGSIEDGDQSANTIADTLIMVNMTSMRKESWQNTTLPADVPGRANAELVWIPVSESGVLIAIGGVINPEVLTASRNLTAAEAQASTQTSPTFMEILPVYDVSTQAWYLQNTTGDIPPQLTLFCSVVAAASDGSSFNIYIYGGYDGIDAEMAPSDDVYILSVPSFTWVKAYSGKYSHGRSGHRCVKVYPDQMFVLGGIFKSDPTICLDGGIIQVFNLNTLQFQDSYSPDVWSEYQVPAVVTAKIGGDANGSATKTSPVMWNDEALAGIFSSMYTKPIATYYPYALPSRPSNNSTVVRPPDKTGDSPVWPFAVIGSVAGLAIIAITAAGWFRRRQHPEPDDTINPSVQRTDANLESPVMAISPTSPVSEEEPEANNPSPTTAVSDISPIQSSQVGSPPIYEMECK